MDDLILRDRDTSEPPNGTLDERLYAMQDANWNVVAIADENGNIQERYTYTAYGTPEFRDPDFTIDEGGTGYDWEYLYTGRRLDDETSLYYYRARYYHAELGRFVSRDPVGFAAADFNLYRYLWNRPVILVDPRGLQPKKSCCGVEVGPHLRAMLKKVKAAFDDLSVDDRFDICEAMVSGVGWDINQFYNAGDTSGKGRSVFNSGMCGAGGCDGSVTVNGNCYWASSVNYLLWGFARRMCRDFYVSQSNGTYITTSHWPTGPYTAAIETKQGYYDVPGRGDPAVVSFEETQRQMRFWRKYKYYSRENEDPSSQPFRRNPGMGIEGREPWITAGWNRDLSFAVRGNINKRCRPFSTRYRGRLTIFLGQDRRHWSATLAPVIRLTVIVTAADAVAEEPSEQGVTLTPGTGWSTVPGRR